MFRKKRDDTLVGTVERQHGINLNARSDTLLGNLLDDRGFDSLSQLLDAYRGKLTYHPTRRRVFLSFHAEDKQQVMGFRLMIKNPKVDIDLYDQGLQQAINSENSSYIKRVIREKIRHASVLLCLIGNGTAWRDWVDWELNSAVELGKGVCGVRLPGSRGRTPPLLKEIGAPIAPWGVPNIVAAIECAAARRN
jgi:hypothetical protein